MADGVSISDDRGALCLSRDTGWHGLSRISLCCASFKLQYRLIPVLILPCRLPEKKAPRTPVMIPPDR